LGGAVSCSDAGRALGRYVMGAKKLHGDDTPVPVLCPVAAPPSRGGCGRTCAMTDPAASTEPAAVLFRYSPDRKGERPKAHLASFVGILQADAYAGFDRLYGERIQEAACWAHVRRKFYDIHVAHTSPIAAEALERIGRLYGIEAEIRGRPSDERRQVRQTRAGPELEALNAWLHATVTTLSKKSELAVAIRYALSLWTALTRYRDDGRLEIDNNAAERALRAVALAARTGSSPDPMMVASVPQQSTVSSAPRNSTTWILKAICVTCSSGSQTIPSTVSRSCCHGTSSSSCHRCDLQLIRLSMRP